MSEQIRRPTSDGVAECFAIPSAPNYGNVDEEVADDNDYNYNAWYGESNRSDIFGISSFSIEEGADTIVVRAVVRMKRTDSDHPLAMVGIIWTTTDFYYQTGTVTWATTEWVDYELVWANNPETAAPWTRDQVNGIGDHALVGMGYQLGKEF